jgi:hypothetical protein
VLACPVIKGTNSRSRLRLARRMTEDLAAALPGRTICVVADAAYAGKELRHLPATVTWTTRLRKDAALHELPPPRTGRRGRPRVKGARLPSILGAGQARNRTASAVRVTVPFTLACQTLAILWHATAGHDPADIEERRARAPWYATKTGPSTTDMIAKLRRVLIAARFRLPHPDQLTPAEISAIRLAWEAPAA